jgi:hypothetical protein
MTTNETILTATEVAANDHGLECTTLADDRCEIEPQRVWPTLPYITGDLLDKAMRNASWGLCQESIADMNKDLAVIAKHDGEAHVREKLYGVLMSALMYGLKERAEMCQKLAK